MGNLTTGAYGSIPIPIQPRPVDPVVIKETAPTQSGTMNAGDREHSGALWKESLVDETLRREENGTSARDMTREALEEAFEDIETVAMLQGKSLRFEEDTESGKHVVKIFDKERGELIRQVPMEEILQMARKLKKYGRGWVDIRV